MNKHSYNPFDAVREARTLYFRRRWSWSARALIGVTHGLPAAKLTPSTEARLRRLVHYYVQDALWWHQADYNRFCRFFGAWIDEDAYHAMAWEERVDLLLLRF